MKPDIEKEIQAYSVAAITMVRGIGGSTKNRCLWKLCDKTLLEWAIQPLKESPFIDRVMVSTESDEIATVAESCGAIIMRRPLHRVLDRDVDFGKGFEKRLKPRSYVHRKQNLINIDVDCLLYCLMELEGYAPDLIFMFSGDGPLGRTETVGLMLRKFFEDEFCTQVITLYETAPRLYIINPVNNRVFPVYDGGIGGLVRQEYPKTYRQGTWNVLGCPRKRQHPESNEVVYKMAHVFIDPEEGLHIHNKEDLFLAECYMKRRLENES